MFLRLKRGVQEGEWKGRGREPRGAVEERHTLCTQGTQNVRDRGGGGRKEQGVNGEREE